MSVAHEVENLRKLTNGFCYETVVASSQKHFEMYIEYITPQRVADPNFTEYHSNGGDYRPTWLVRTFDWEKVPGREAINGYHTLSYCWEQSGEMIQKEYEKYDLLDDGQHRVTKQKGEQFVTYEVTYDQLLQQICKDFDIEYLWYDKICIDQTNKEEKHREIKHMHLIYSNARYTVAVVPEIYIEDPKEFDTKVPVPPATKAKNTASTQMKKSLWNTRSWTLEEVMMSTRMLVIGRNTHFWSLSYTKQEKAKENDELATFILGFQDRKVKSTNQILHHAHQRTSTKEHDKIFALANILYGVTSIDINYDHDFSTVMNSFYRQLAQRDLSIMFFGANVYPWGEKPAYRTTVTSYNLPSWTGVAGLHSSHPIVDIALGESGCYSIDDSMNLHIRCRSYTIRPSKYDDYFASDDEREQQAHSNYNRLINSMDDFDSGKTEALDWSQLCMLMASMFNTHYTMRAAACCSPILPLSITESSDECIVLGAIYTIPTDWVADNNDIVGKGCNYLSPVVVKSSTDNSVYKVIGVILLKHFVHDEPRKSPNDFTDEMFDQLGRSEYQDFCIR